ncbi:MAG: lysylphosphatidylglycerol synthase domain-containing protein [Phycisphaerales bacterium JB037]
MSDAREPGTDRALRRARLKLVLQLLAFAGGLLLFAWMIRIALSEKNQEQLSKLGEAPWWQVGLLLGLSAATLAINGLIFWITLMPKRRLRMMDVQATNAIATALAYLPAKLSALSRIAIHNRRDGVPILLITSWFGAFGSVMLLVLGPLVAASLWRGGLDAWWWIASIGGIVLLAAATVAMGRFFEGDRGIDRLHALIDPLRLRALQRFLRTDAWRKMHAGFDMLADARMVAATAALRLLDIGVQAGRFIVIAWILGLDLRTEDAVLVASTYFLVGVFSPAGNLGTREASVVGAAAALGIGSADAFAAAALAVTATESAVFLLGAFGGIAWLGPRRLLGLGKRAADESEPGLPDPARSEPSPTEPTIAADEDRTRADQPDRRSD